MLSRAKHLKMFIHDYNGENQIADQNDNTYNKLRLK
jgi:hypothetical protein